MDKTDVTYKHHSALRATRTIRGNSLYDNDTAKYLHSCNLTGRKMNLASQKFEFTPPPLIIFSTVYTIFNMPVSDVCCARMRKNLHTGENKFTYGWKFTRMRMYVNLCTHATLDAYAYGRRQEERNYFFNTAQAEQTAESHKQ